MAQPGGGRGGIVTPEAVLLEFESAGIGSRLLGELVDLAVQFGLFLAFFIVLGLFAGTTGSLPQWIGIVIVTVAGFLIVFGYPIGMEALWNGRTLGKAALGLRVVTREGAPIRFRHAALRGMLALVDFYLLSGMIAITAILFTRRNQRLGDLAAGTIVVRERQAAAAAVAVSFPPPPGYEGYVASLDVAALDAEQYGIIRSFLLRVLELAPEARIALAVRLANPVAQLLRHRPPPGVGPEVFLVCVAAAYQRRHGGPGDRRGP